MHALEKKDCNFVSNNSDFTPVPSIVKRFVPDKHIIFYDPNSDHPERMIFEIDGPFLDFEERHIRKLNKLIRNHERREEIEKMMSRFNKLRFLQANNYKYEQALENILTHIKYVKENLPIALNDDSKRLLSNGLLYIHGRDKSFRPILIFRTSVLTELSEREYPDAMDAMMFVILYTINHLLVPGKVENYNVISDMGDSPVLKVPVKFCIEMARIFQTHFKCRAHLCIALRATFGIKTIWKLISPFVDEKIRSKIVISSEETDEILSNTVHPSQLERKYGGEAENLTCFWPPRFRSNTFGHNPCLIQSERRSQASAGSCEEHKLASSRSKLQMTKERLIGLVDPKTSEVYEDIELADIRSEVTNDEEIFYEMLSQTTNPKVRKFGCIRMHKGMDEGFCCRIF